MPDAVVIGAGPNGLVGANLLVDAGWDVVVLEANDTPGGAVRTAEATVPGYRHDLFSAFYPMGAASPVLRRLELERYGLRWCHAPLVLAHHLADGRAALLSRNLDETAANLDALEPGDGDRWRALCQQWDDGARAMLDAVLSPFPPVRAGLQLARSVGPSPRDLVRFARFALLPVRRMAAETFRGEGPGLLLAGNACHTDLSPDGAGSGVFGWILSMIGQQNGFPVPEGGAQGLADALVTRLRSRGGEVLCGSPVVGIEVRDGRAVAVRTAAGDEVEATRAVLAGCSALTLYRKLLAPDHLPSQLLDDLDRYELSPATVKFDWALSGRIPWRHPDVARAGTVHIADSIDELSLTAGQISAGLVPDRPFLLFGQMAVADPTRAPAGAEVAWAYTHVPHDVHGDAGGAGITGRWDDAETDAFADRVEARIEALAPGFRDRIVGRHVFTPAALEAANANLVGGDVMGGTSGLHQQFVFRPTPGWGRPETPVKGLYLASASAHPGGGVHGACGANAARAALAHDRLRSVVVRPRRPRTAASRPSLPGRDPWARR